jgi:hypothetical protein
MHSVFFIGDAFMVLKKGMSQNFYSFVGAKKTDNTNRWILSIQSSLVNGYAGGSSTIVWDVEVDEELRVSGNMKGFVTVDGFNREKTKEKPIKALKLIEIQKDMIKLEFVV